MQSLEEVGANKITAKNTGPLTLYISCIPLSISSNFRPNKNKKSSYLPFYKFRLYLAFYGAAT
jgi:hypothetical protein